MNTDTRDAYMGRVLQNPATMNFTEIRFIYAAQIITGSGIRQRCQYACGLAHQSTLSPPLTPTAADTRHALDEYRYGLIVRREADLTERHFTEVWQEFSDRMVEFEHESFIRGYPKAFVPAIGTCLCGHNDDTLRPCEYRGKTRPTFEAIGINLGETLDMIGWQSFIARDHHEPFQMFSVLMLD